MSDQPPGPRFETMYEGPSGFHDDTSMFVQARRFDFGKFFETIEEDDLGSPVSSDLIFKTKTRLENGDIEFLAIVAPETYERTVDNVLAGKEKGEGAADLTLQDDEQDLMLTGVTWRRRFGNDGEWTREPPDRTAQAGRDAHRTRGASRLRRSAPALSGQHRSTLGSVGDERGSG